jgi:hypothetical protein
MFEAKLVPHGGHHVDFQGTDLARLKVVGSEKETKMVEKLYLKFIIVYFS